MVSPSGTGNGGTDIQVFERELETGRQFKRISESLGKVGEEVLHLSGDFRWRSELRARSRPAVANVQ